MVNAGESRLYDGSDPGIVLLDVNNFTSFITGRPNVAVVQFYNHWCGHCINFAPKWKEFAKDVESWKQIVVGVVDCVDDINVQLCRHYRIDAYPSLRIFHSHFATDEMPFVAKVGPLESIREQVVDFLSSEEELKYTNASSLAQLTHPRDTGQLFAIIEANNSYVGRQVLYSIASKISCTYAVGLFELK